MKAATKAKAPSPPPAPMLYKKKPSKKAAKGIKGITWPDSHDSLEMAKFFYKADPPVACNPDPDVVEKQLYQYTPLQSTYSIINIALDHFRCGGGLGTSFCSKLT